MHSFFWVLICSILYLKKKKKLILSYIQGASLVIVFLPLVSPAAPEPCRLAEWNKMILRLRRQANSSTCSPKVHAKTRSSWACVRNSKESRAARAAGRVFFVICHPVIRARARCARVVCRPCGARWRARTLKKGIRLILRIHRFRTDDNRRSAAILGNFTYPNALFHIKNQHSSSKFS